jgi:signal transduction histidine kinase
MNRASVNQKSYNPCILIVDDDSSVLKSIERFLHAYPLQIFTASAAAEGIEILHANGPFQVVISDYLMPITNGDQFLGEVARTWPDSRRVILSAYADRKILLSAINEGRVHRYVTKPWDDHELLTVIQELLEEYRTIEATRSEVQEIARKNQMLALTNQQLEDLVNDRTADLVVHQKQLQDTNQRLRQLSGHMEELREQERRAIAREIHDELAQSLSAIKLEISNLLPVAANQALRQRLLEVKHQVDHTLETVQRILSALRPQVLDELGLEAALEWLVNDFSRRSGIDATLLCSLDSAPLPVTLSTCLFRITQEALTNILRHAGATQITVRAWQEEDQIHLSIKDNGTGIAAERRNAGDSFGLLGMEERTSLCGGHFMITCPPEGGTLVAADFPLISLLEDAP